MKAVKEKMAETNKAVRVVLLIVYDIASLLLSAFFALYIRFDFKMERINVRYLDGAFGFLPVTALVLIIVYSVLHLYNSLWSYASTRELLHPMGGALLVSMCQTAAMVALNKNMPRSY